MNKGMPIRLAQLLFIVAAVTVVVLLASGPSRAAPMALVNIKLSGELQPGGNFGSVGSWAITPDNQYVLYANRDKAPAAGQLFRVPSTGGEPQLLSDPSAPQTGIGGLLVTPDSRRVVYRAANDNSDVSDLYVMEIAGGPPKKLTEPVTTGDILSYMLSPDGNWVVYWTGLAGDLGGDTVLAIYSVPIDGGPVTQLNAPLPVGSYLGHNFLISPDSNWVVYRINYWPDDVVQLNSVRIQGGEAVQLYRSPAAGEYMLDFNIQISHDSSTVVYAVYQPVGAVKLYGSPIEGGARWQLNDPSGPDGGVADFLIAPDTGWVVFRSDQQTDDVYELYSVPLGGGAAEKLNAPLVADGDVNIYLITPDSSRVVYVADQETDGVEELYSTPIRGGAVQKLNVPLSADGDIDRHGLSITHDSSRVVYQVVNYVTNDEEALYSVAIDGGPSTRLTLPLEDEQIAFEYPQITPDSDQVVYALNNHEDQVAEIYGISLDEGIDGGPPTRLSGEMVAEGSVEVYSITVLDTNRVVYVANQENPKLWELFTTFDDSLLTPPAMTPRVFVPAMVR